MSTAFLENLTIDSFKSLCEALKKFTKNISLISISCTFLSNSSDPTQRLINRLFFILLLTNRFRLYNKIDFFTEKKNKFIIFNNFPLEFLHSEIISTEFFSIDQNFESSSKYDQIVLYR
ncbi:hypothetical protein BpHYR1_045590 [Brachionus plicatilis]|uniref:Uncharacterized protein n=1 Tax=Brachionus plicatilis TaxID=10195 RepID=A0A3M7QPU9_BRAPC|nr:hypothetical protein BpHYR1_045590 [Brachionus plicatilis]